MSEHVLIPELSGKCDGCVGVGDDIDVLLTCDKRNSSGLSCGGDNFIVVEATPENIAKAAAYRLGVVPDE